MKENSNVTDTNVGDIEECIKRLEKSTEDMWFDLIYSQKDKDKDIQILLSDYKRVLKENEELKNKLLDTLKGQKVIEEETPQYVKENYISKEEIKRQLMRSALRKDRYYNRFIRE